jgi:YD repeat-containing protein
LQVAAETDAEVLYTPEDPQRYTLRASKTAGQITGWSVQYPDGVRLLFDAAGLLSRIEDSTAHGLTVSWVAVGPGGIPQVSTVTDASGRIVQFTYNGDGRLLRVREDSTGLEVTYEYTGKDLHSVHDANGRTETYEYSPEVLLVGGINPETGAPNIGGGYVPEGMIREACEELCAPAASSCRAGGLCDAIGPAMEFACVDGLLACEGQCESACNIAAYGGGTAGGNGAFPECAAICDANATGLCEGYCDVRAYEEFWPECHQDNTLAAGFAAECLDLCNNPQPKRVACGQACTSQSDCPYGLQCLGGECLCAGGVCDSDNTCQRNVEFCEGVIPACHGTVYLS